MLALALTLMLACDGGNTGVGGDGTTDDSGDTGPVVDEACPTITHTPIEAAMPLGEPIDVSAVVVDDLSGVFVVKLYYKQETTTTWDDVGMTLSGTDTYTAQMPGSAVGSGGMDYYIQAVDIDQNGCTLPLDGESDPFHFRVTAG
ncbi:hypothetical protein L6R53_26235 [Myxococcota bacterium]|nr:hypothetical protein [Myxococcota bacterium]